MTHAALKDQKASISDLRQLRASLLIQQMQERMETCNAEYVDSRIAALDSAIAALSAMEGEAVAWPNRMVNLPCPDGSTDRIVGFRVPEGDPILGKHGLSEPLAWLRKVTIERTAPPPQQAEHVHEWIIDPDLGAGSGYLYCRVCKVTRKHDSLADTHPTPSPGPQGGGEDDALRRVLAYADELTKRDQRREVAEWKKELAEVLSRRPSHMATPPAHQPGEVVTDAMVERMAKWLCRQEIGESATLDVVLWRMTKWERYVGEARAALTAALAPKEAGHG